MRPEMLPRPSATPLSPFLILRASPGQEGDRGEGRAHISGSFCVSMTAAIGMPKLDAGPQKSVADRQRTIVPFLRPVALSRPWGSTHASRRSSPTTDSSECAH